MEAGCHVFVEKPMALTLEETDAMNAAAGRNGVKLCVGHSRVCAPLMLKARNLVESGKIGKVLHVDVSYNFDIATVLPAGTNSDAKMGWIQSLPGGVLFDLMPHPVSILLQFIKEPLHICATGANNGSNTHGGLNEVRAFFIGTEVTGFLSVSLGARPDGLASARIWNEDVDPCSAPEHDAHNVQTETCSQSRIARLGEP